MFNKIVTVNDLINSLKIIPVEVQKSKSVRGLHSTYYDLTSFDAPIVGLYEGDRWSVFVYSFYDSDGFFKDYGTSRKYAGALKNSENNVIQYNFRHKADLNFFDFPEELFGVKSLKEARLFKRSGIGTVYKADKRKFFIQRMSMLAYDCSKIFKSYYWVSKFRIIARHSNIPLPESVKQVFENWSLTLQEKHDARMDKVMFGDVSKSSIVRFLKKILLKSILRFSDFKSRFKVAAMRLFFPKLYFVNKYYKMGYNRAENHIWDFVQTSEPLKAVMGSAYGWMDLKQQRKQYVKSLYRYVMVIGLDGVLVASSFKTFGEEGFVKFAKLVASGLTVEEILSVDVSGIPDNWLEGIYLS